MNPLTLPDIAAQTTHQAVALDWVGMCGIALPIQLEGQRLTASADAGVSLDDAQSRGIHMSRLYLALDALQANELNTALLRSLLHQFLQSHEGLSSSAYVRLSFDHLLDRPALISPLSGWKRYPIEVEARLTDKVFHVELFIQIPYSSTCPCSAALARQLIQERFSQAFEGQPLDHNTLEKWLGTTQGIVATPHSQRSVARLKVRLDSSLNALPIKALIDSAEGALGTAVQTAVKRADEQAFALANGQNLMFCEDAARRLHVALRSFEGQLSGFEIRVEHAESLHAHDAVAVSRWCW